MDSPQAVITAQAQPAGAILVTASRLPESANSTPATVSIIDNATITRVGAPFVSDYLRLLPSTSVSTSGPAGALTEVRIRGAEANHTLLFIDGIRANDPAAGNAPRFELLNADITSRIEEVRGPQSALWGSEAIGGVVAVQGDPAAKTGASMMAEAGSFATYRGSAAVSYAAPGLTAAFAVAGQKSRGTDAFDGTGDRDGYDNKSARGRLAWQAAPLLQIGAAGFTTSGLSEFDGFDPNTFVHADTLDNTRNRLRAGRAWMDLGTAERAWSASLSASLLGSSNVNRLANTPINQTRASRRTLTAELRNHVQLGELEQSVVVAAEREDERFHTRDVAYGGATNQDQDRQHDSVTVQWRAQWRMLTGDIAVRRDLFNRFKDATTTRASLLARLGSGLELVGSYAEGIAQPTFFDLYGFFPGTFAGNPLLRPESSRGLEGSARWRNEHWSVTLSAYQQRLRDEIMGTFDPATGLQSTANGAGVSYRRGVEGELSYARSPALRIHANAAYLHATEPAVTPGLQVKETRRPAWSGALLVDGTQGRLSYGASMAYTGARTDVDFDSFPATTVRLGSYWLAGARVAYRVSRSAEIFGRAANAFNASYRDVVGYKPSGRSIDGGIRLAFGG